MTQPQITPGDWDWADFGSGPVLIANHRHRPVVLGASISHRDLDMPIPYLSHCDATGKLVMIHPDHPDATLLRAAPNLLAACEYAFGYLTNVHAFDVDEVAQKIVLAMIRAGYDPELLNPILHSKQLLHGLINRQEGK